MKPGPIERQARLALFGMLYLIAGTKVLVRRQFYGPKLPEWPLLLELITEIVQVNVGERRSLSVRSISHTVKVKGKPISGTTILPVTVAGVPSEWVVHNTALDATRVVLYFHGGAYCLMNPESHRFLTSSISKTAHARVLAVDYRLAPENPFPAALEDAVAVYQWLISDKGGACKPSNIVFGGDSAGGGLTLATLLKLRDLGLPLPAGGVCLSPWADLTCSLPSWAENEKFDYLPLKGTHQFSKAYAQDNDLRNPYISPLFGDYKDLPPLLIQVGGAECLRDDAIQVAEKAKEAGVQVTLEVYEHMVHVFQMLNFLPLSADGIKGIATFVKQRIPETVSRTTLVKTKSRL